MEEYLESKLEIMFLICNWKMLHIINSPIVCWTRGNSGSGSVARQVQLCLSRKHNVHYHHCLDRRKQRLSPHKLDGSSSVSTMSHNEKRFGSVQDWTQILTITHYEFYHLATVVMTPSWPKIIILIIEIFEHYRTPKNRWSMETGTYSPIMLTSPATYLLNKLNEADLVIREWY